MICVPGDTKGKRDPRTNDRKFLEWMPRAWARAP